MRWWWGPFCTRPTRLVVDFIVLAHRNNSSRINISLHSDTLSWSEWISLCSTLMMRTQRNRTKYQFHNLWFYPIGPRTHDLPHSRRACWPLHHDTVLLILVQLIVDFLFIIIRFPICRFWVNLMKVITETRCVHLKWYLRFHYLKSLSMRIYQNVHSSFLSLI
jgi:hypothetical protein